MKQSALLLMALVLTALPAAADNSASAPVIFSKTILKIIPAPASESAKTAIGKDARKPATREAVEFTVEVRPEQFLEQHDFMVHTAFTDKSGMMVVITLPEARELRSTNLLGTVDALFVSPTGEITKIAPSLNLSTLEAPIASEGDVRAFVFLAPGITKAHDIRPGDRIENPLFHTLPVVLGEPSPAAAPAVEQAAPVAPVSETPSPAKPTPRVARLTVLNPGDDTAIPPPANAPLIIPSLGNR